MLKGQELIKELKRVSSEKIREQLKMTVIQQQHEKEKSLIIEKPYRPSKKTMERLRNEISGLEDFIQFFSPYKWASIEMKSKKIFVPLLNKVYGLSEKTMQRLEEDTKIHLMEESLIGLRKTFYAHRQIILSRGFMFEDDFLEKRLEYLMRNGEEAKSKPESVYKFIEEKFLQIMKEAIIIYFKIKEFNTDNRFSLEFHQEELLIKYRALCLTEIEDMNPQLIGSLQKFFYKELLFGDSKELRKIYPKLKVKLLTYNLLVNNVKRNEYIFKYHEIFALCNSLDRYKELMDLEEMEMLANVLVTLIQEFCKELQDENRKNEVLKYSRNLYVNMDTIKDIIEELEVKKEN